MTVAMVTHTHVYLLFLFIHQPGMWHKCYKNTTNYLTQTLKSLRQGEKLFDVKK